MTWVCRHCLAAVAEICVAQEFIRCGCIDCHDCCTPRRLHAVIPEET